MKLSSRPPPRPPPLPLPSSPSLLPPLSVAGPGLADPGPEAGISSLGAATCWASCRRVRRGGFSGPPGTADLPPACPPPPREVEPGQGHAPVHMLCQVWAQVPGRIATGRSVGAPRASWCPQGPRSREDVHLRERPRSPSKRSPAAPQRLGMPLDMFLLTDTVLLPTGRHAAL